MSAAKQHEGASNCHTLVSPILCQIYHFQNVPYKVSCIFAPTSLESQQVAIITAGGLLGIHSSHSSNLKAH